MMFSKGTWTLLKLKQGDGESAPIDTFKQAFEDAGTTYIPLVAISRAIHEQTKTVGLAPFNCPRLGDEEDIEFYFETKEGVTNPEYKVEPLDTFIVNYDMHEWEAANGELKSNDIRVPLAPFWKDRLEDWQFAPNVYGMWFMLFEYIDALDANSKKEQLAYNYGAPFKLQTAEIKKQIQEQIIDANTFTRKHHQIIFDFNMGYVWINTGSKGVVLEAMALFDRFGLNVEMPEDLIDEIGADEISGVLNDLYASSTIGEDQVRRLAEMKLHGPGSIEPDQDAVKEKLLKAFCAFSEIDGSHVGMSTPMALYLAPGFITTTGAKTTFEVTELFATHEDATIAEAGLTFCDFTEKTAKSGETRKILSKRFSITASPNFYFTGDDAPPGLIIRGLNIENFKYLVKVHTKATDNVPTIAEYWQIYYDAMKVSVFTYFSILKDLVTEKV